MKIIEQTNISYGIVCVCGQLIAYVGRFISTATVIVVKNKVSAILKLLFCRILVNCAFNSNVTYIYLIANNGCLLILNVEQIYRRIFRRIFICIAIEVDCLCASKHSKRLISLLVRSAYTCNKKFCLYGITNAHSVRCVERHPSVTLVCINVRSAFVFIGVKTKLLVALYVVNTAVVCVGRYTLIIDYLIYHIHRDRGTLIILGKYPVDYILNKEPDDNGTNDTQNHKRYTKPHKNVRYDSC